MYLLLLVPVHVGAYFITGVEYPWQKYISVGEA
jgi:hypothetical protein